MATQSRIDANGTERDRMPAPLRYAVFGTLGLLMTGALYLIVVRGEALLIDLSGLAGRIFCF